MNILKNILKSVCIGVICVWALISVNPQVYISILLNPHKIVLYMDIADMDEDIFYYFKTSPDSDEYHQYQEEVKRDEVKKGKSFLKMKASVNLINSVNPLIFIQSNPVANLICNVITFSNQEYGDTIFHPPKIIS